MELESTYMMANIKIPVEILEDGTYNIFSDLYSIEFTPYEMDTPPISAPEPTNASLTTILATEINRRHIGNKHTTTLKNSKKSVNRFSRRNTASH
jgi:hypothetical protein